MDIFKTIIAPIIVGLVLLAVAESFSWNYVDKMRDYIIETIDIFLFTLIVFIIGFIAGQISNTPKWFLFLIGPWMKPEPIPEPIQVENPKETDNSEQSKILKEFTELLAGMGFGNNTDTSKIDSSNTQITSLKNLIADMGQQKDKPSTDNEQEGQKNE